MKKNGAEEGEKLFKIVLRLEDNVKCTNFFWQHFAQNYMKKYL